jgi:hypothetical protein
MNNHYDLTCSQCCLHRAVVVAMISMRVVKVTVHYVVYVIAVGNRFVSTTIPVLVALFVASAIVVWGARCWVFASYVDLVFIDVTIVRVVEVPIMKIILVIIMFHRSMSAIRTVDVRVPFVNLMLNAHFNAPFAFEFSCCFIAGTSLA